MDAAVQEYFDAVPGSRRHKIETLHSAILQRFPRAIVDMQYKMPTYKYGEGWVAIANQKSYVSLYTCSAEHLKEFKESYPGIKTGKGCINFQDKDEIPVAAIRAVIEHAILHPKGKQP